MINIQYKGKNYLLFGRIKIANGNNEVSEDDFYELLKYSTFKTRVQTGEIKLPPGFTIEKFNSKKALKDSIKGKKDVEEKAEPEVEHEHSEDEESHVGDKTSVRQTLKSIHKSEDLDYLYDLANNDEREKVKEAAQKRLDALEAETKK